MCKMSNVGVTMDSTIYGELLNKHTINMSFVVLGFQHGCINMSLSL